LFFVQMFEVNRARAELQPSSEDGAAYAK
jgi:hypothetical protein